MEYRQNSSKFQYENLETEAKSIPSNTHFCSLYWLCTDTLINKGNNKITELRTILQRESQNS